MHAKVLWCKPYLVLGSTNWTTAAKSNVEAGLICMMEYGAAGTVGEWFTDIENHPQCEEVMDIDAAGKGQLSRRELEARRRKKGGKVPTYSSDDSDGAA